MRQWRTNKAPTGAGSGDSAGAREDSPTEWGKCREATKGDGPCTAGPRKKGTQSVPPKKVSKQRRGNHPVDGSPERLCGPPGGAAVMTEQPFFRKAANAGIPAESYSPAGRPKGACAFHRPALPVKSAPYFGCVPQKRQNPAHLKSGPPSTLDFCRKM